MIWDGRIWLWNWNLSVRVRGYETYNTKEVKTEHKRGKEEEEETAKEEAPVPLVTRVSTILRSIFSNVEMYINNQQIYNSNGLYARKSYISKNFKGAISEYKGVLHCEGYDYEELPDENYGSAFVWIFFHKENENA